MSPQQRRIADLADTGKTSREIPDELRLSTRTIEAHLGRLSRKLGITRLMQLTEALSKSDSALTSEDASSA
jgi:DNA-binding NarL/FixJ family response regulator